VDKIFLNMTMKIHKAFAKKHGMMLGAGGINAG
jgi:hypothetical protein